MNLFPKKVNTDSDLSSSNERIESLEPDQHEINIADGGEFMDDALRMKEQPFEGAARKEEE